MSKKLTLIAVALLFSATASADFIAVGEPEEGDSWSQAFNESGVGQFDFMAIRMTSTDLFQPVAMRSLGTWTNFDVTPKLSYAEGPATSNKTFGIYFAGAKSDPLEFEFFAFNGEELLEGANVAWSGSSWTITGSSETPTRTSLMIPLPGAVLLGLIGLTTVAWLRRRIS